MAKIRILAMILGTSDSLRGPRGVVSGMPDEATVIASLRNLARLLREGAPQRELADASEATAELMRAYVRVQSRPASPELVGALEEVEKAKQQHPATTVN